MTPFHRAAVTSPMGIHLSFLFNGHLLPVNSHLGTFYKLPEGRSCASLICVFTHRTQLKILGVIISQMFVELKLGPRLRFGCSSKLFQAPEWVG